MMRPSCPPSPGEVLACALVPLLSTYCMQALSFILRFLFTEAPVLYTEPSAGHSDTSCLTYSTHTISFLGKRKLIFIQSLPTASLDILPTSHG